MLIMIQHLVVQWTYVSRELSAETFEVETIRATKVVDIVLDILQSCNNLLCTMYTRIETL